MSFKEILHHTETTMKSILTSLEGSLSVLAPDRLDEKVARAPLPIATSGNVKNRTLSFVQTLHNRFQQSIADVAEAAVLAADSAFEDGSLAKTEMDSAKDQISELQKRYAQSVAAMCLAFEQRLQYMGMSMGSASDFGKTDHNAN